MRRIGLLGAVALLTSIVSSTPAFAIPDSWLVQDLSEFGSRDTCDFGKLTFTCWFGSRGECQYWLSQVRRAEIFGDIGRCVPADPVLAPEGADWEFNGDLF